MAEKKQEEPTNSSKFLTNIDHQMTLKLTLVLGPQ